MKYLLELNEFKDNEIELICKRIISSGYISKSMEVQLKSITGINDVVDQLYDRVEFINSIFENNKLEFFDDVLLEFFDGSNYDYVTKIGIYDSTIYQNIKGNLIFDEEYNTTDDKERYLLSKLLMFINEKNKQEIKSKDDLIDSSRDRKNRSFGNGRLGKQDSYHNYFKSIINIKPMISVDIKNKQYSEYYHQYDYTDDPTIYIRGWNSNQFDSYSNQDSISNRIKRRFSNYKIFGNCEISTHPYGGGHYTDSAYLRDEFGRMVINDNRILLFSNLEIRLI